MRQQKLLNAFLDGATEGVAKSLSIDGEQLVHYNTAIAERYNNRIILNYTRYSLASGRVQKMITDTVDDAMLVYVSGVPSGTRRTLVDYLMSADSEDVAGPEEYLMVIRHAKFGRGFVLSIDNDKMRCLFGRQEKLLLYPAVIESGLVEVIEDKR